MTSRPRFLSRTDGTFNVSRKGLKRGFDFYHRLLSISWGHFLGAMGLLYLCLNTLFALVYFSLGEGALSGGNFTGEWGHWWDCFFFSVHTLATIGYGTLAPHSLGANLVVVVEAFVGLTGIAIATGLLFARFSRPTARVVFSRRAVIRVRNGQTFFQFRMANERLNQIVSAEVEVVAAFDEVTQEGERTRTFRDLKLVRDRSPFFAMTWTVLHPIDAESPLFGLNSQSLRDRNPEILVSLTGFDDIFSQTIHARFSYTEEDIAWGGQFKDIVNRDEAGRVRIDLDAIHEITAAP